MTDNRPYKICLVFALILFLGLGLALVMPWVASSQSQAAQSDIEVLTSIIEMPERGNGIGVNTSPEARTNLVPTIVTRYYVATTGDGSDPTLGWTTAYTNVQDALAVAVETSEIWIAEGVYYPDQGVGQIDNAVKSTFFMTDGVALYGGFDTNDSDINDRDWENNVTVLSGDIDGDDTTDTNDVVTDTANISGNNAYHVVTGSGVTGTAVLDGFTITAGKANGNDAPDYSGGGFFCDGSGSGDECSPSLSNITFSGNSADIKGGAMFNDGASSGTSSPSLNNVTFSGNSAILAGGAMFNYGYNNGSSSPTLSNVTFSGNSANYGGAMYNDGTNGGTSSPSLSNVTFSGNWADLGGAMYNDGASSDSSSPTLSNVTFSGNSANYGGAMFNNGSGSGNSSPSMSNVTFSGNWAGLGGAMFNYGFNNGSSSPTLSNVTFSGNSANYGGAMFNNGSWSGNSSPSMSNVTFSGNWAGLGGAMYNDGTNGGTCSPEVRNSILWNNKDSSGTGTITATISNYSATITLTHSLAQGTGDSDNWTSDSSFVNGMGNIDADPLFILDIDPSTAPTTTGNLRLQSGSTAIDAGDNTFAAGVLTDLDGEARIKDGDGDGTATVDMGAYESEALYLLTVTKAGTGGGLVTSTPAGIDCGDTCSVIFYDGTVVTLTATADTGSTFSGWSGACSGTTDCVVTMNAAKSVTATFMVTVYNVFLPIIMK